ncbi:hypothetical protein KBA27_02335 [bacterium]|nr:hypothetical protein [bacterium]
MKTFEENNVITSIINSESVINQVSAMFDMLESNGVEKKEVANKFVSVCGEFENDIVSALNAMNL